MSQFPRPRDPRLCAIAGGVLVVLTVASFYLVPLAILALCIQIGLHAEPAA